jgi:hypothetical protein
MDHQVLFYQGMRRMFYYDMSSVEERGRGTSVRKGAKRPGRNARKHATTTTARSFARRRQRNAKKDVRNARSYARRPLRNARKPVMTMIARNNARKQRRSAQKLAKTELLR